MKDPAEWPSPPKDDAITRRIRWLRLRARIARNNGDHILRAELEETADQVGELLKGVQLALLSPENWKEALRRAISNIEDRATR